MEKQIHISDLKKFNKKIIMDSIRIVSVDVNLLTDLTERNSGYVSRLCHLLVIVFSNTMYDVPITSIVLCIFR